jgi:hypothetical protein
MKSTLVCILVCYEYNCSYYSTTILLSKILLRENLLKLVSPNKYEMRQTEEVSKYLQTHE